MVSYDAQTNQDAILIERRHRLSWWDCIALASALQARCGHFVSEDLNDGQVIESLTVVNPFASHARHAGADLTDVFLMGFKCGIVGLPNVGKSTLFNALTQTAAAQAANYPFCTIEPNVGEVAMPDPRLDDLARIASSKEIVPTRLTFVDIAGLVRGASKGRGSATSSSPISARSMPSPMSCAASPMATSPMSRARSTRTPISRRSRPS